jgi:hypothetical protein
MRFMMLVGFLLVLRFRLFGGIFGVFSFILFADRALLLGVHGLTLASLTLIEDPLRGAVLGKCGMGE